MIKAHVCIFSPMFTIYGENSLEKKSLLIILKIKLVVKAKNKS